MAKIFTPLLLLFFLVGCATDGAPTASEVAPQTTLISNVTAIDAAQGERPNVDVVIAKDKIVAVGAGLASKYAGSASKQIDGTGKFLIPGLWDAHVHLAYNPGVDHRTFFPLSLAHGVTSLRDTGGHLDKLSEARALASSDALTPDLYVSGPLIDGAKRVYAGQSPGSPDLSVGAATPADVVKAVDDLAAQNVDFLKAYEMLAPDTFEALVDRAKYHNLPVTAHSPLSMSATAAVKSGIRDMQHLRNLELDCTGDAELLLSQRIDMIHKDQSETGGKLRSAIHRAQRPVAVAAQNPKACDDLISLMVENNVSQTPTLTITTFLGRRLYAEKRWQETYGLVPQSVAKRWQESSRALSKRQPSENDIAFQNWVVDMIARLDKAGVTIIAGTDAPIGFLTPGVSLHEELAMLVEAGLSPMAAITAATYAPAEFLGLEKQMGNITAGMNADLVLLNKNPLQDIRNTMAIENVFKDGRLLDRTALDALRAQPSRLNDE